MRCLVTGASGHLGSYLVRRLLRDGHEVTGMVRRESDLWRLKDLPSGLRLIHGDLADVDSMSGEIKAASPEVVFHLAWFGVASPHRDDPRQVDCNLMGTVRLLQRAQESGCRCWVGLGSQAEYGVCAGILREDVPTQPITLYGAAKLSAGLLTRQLCRLGGTRYVWLRLLATYGPKDDEHHLIPSVIHQLLAGQRPSLTSGEQRWDYLYIEDAAEALYRAAFSQQVEGVFNLGSGEAHRVRDIVEQIRDLIDPSLPLGFGELPDQKLQLKVDIAQLKQASGWVPQVTLEDGLRRTIAWCREARNSVMIAPR